MNEMIEDEVTNVYIWGKPKAEFEIDDLPSWNQIAAMGHWNVRKLKKYFRETGARLAHKFRLVCKIRGFVIERRTLVIVRVQTPHEGEFDVFNVNIKYLTDGFTDGKIWANDDWTTIPLVMFMWDGFHYNGGKKWNCIVEVHELGRLMINGSHCKLPMGRIVEAENNSR